MAAFNINDYNNPNSPDYHRVLGDYPTPSTRDVPSPTTPGQILAANQLYGPAGGSNAPTSPGDPRAFQPIIAGRDELVRQILGDPALARTGEFNPTSPSLGSYTENPHLGAINSTIQALISGQGMAGRDLGGYGDAREADVFRSDTSNLAPTAHAALHQQELARIQPLIDNLMKTYGLGGSIFGEQLSEEAAKQNIKTGELAARQQALSGIPIVGSLVGGLAGHKGD